MGWVMMSERELQRVEVLAQVDDGKLSVEAGAGILADLAGGKSGKTVSAPKYQDPNDPTHTWTGRGRKPGWFQAALDAGTSPEDMMIT